MFVKDAPPPFLPSCVAETQYRNPFHNIILYPLGHKNVKDCLALELGISVQIACSVM